MLTVKAEKKILDRLRELLASEEKGTCVRLREYTMGGG